VPGSASAVALPYEATFTFELAAATPLVLEANGMTDVATDGSFALPADLFMGMATAAVPQTDNQPFAQIQVEFRNGAGQFEGPGVGGGTMPLLGKVRLFGNAGFGDATFALTPVFTQNFNSATVMGGGFGALTLTNTVNWGVGLFLQVGGFFTPFSSFTTTASRTRTGFDNRTAMFAGPLNLVAPISFSSGLDEVPYAYQPVTGQLAITFAPEPGAALRPVAGVALLAALGVRRLRRR
jgi:hypothetical protein